MFEAETFMLIKLDQHPAQYRPPLVLYVSSEYFIPSQLAPCLLHVCNALNSVELKKHNNSSIVVSQPTMLMKIRNRQVQTSHQFTSNEPPLPKISEASIMFWRSLNVSESSNRWLSKQKRKGQRIFPLKLCFNSPIFLGLKEKPELWKQCACGMLYIHTKFRMNLS